MATTNYYVYYGSFGYYDDWISELAGFYLPLRKVVRPTRCYYKMHEFKKRMLALASSDITYIPTFIKIRPAVLDWKI
jgi:hypothetical protein